MTDRFRKGDTAVIKWDGQPPEQVKLVYLPCDVGETIVVKYSNGLLQRFSPLRTDYVLEKMTDNPDTESRKEQENGNR